jgi:hypothetical protein
VSRPRVAAALTVVLLAVLMGPAQAAMLKVDPGRARGSGLGVADNGVIRTAGPVDRGKCDHCHGAPGLAKNPLITFPHAYHLGYRCEICHTTFPHQLGTTLRVGMNVCVGCHGLRHGSSSSLAKDGFKSGCGLCHRVRPLSRPGDHRARDWAGRGHVLPSTAGASGRCMMCHTQAQCEGCHRLKHVKPVAASTYVFAGGNLCLSCHGDANLSATFLGQRRSFFVSSAVLLSSVHPTATCTRCHTDFRYFVDRGAARSARANASIACSGCHPKQTKVWLGSIHGRLSRPGAMRSARYPDGPALCGSCHGGHGIYGVTTRAGAAALRSQSAEVCGSGACHQDKYLQYDDYYHGAAYKKGAADAPSCWQCHGAHQILPASDPSSTVSPAMLPVTCGKCHPGTRQQFAQYAKLIHRSVRTREGELWRVVLATISSWMHPLGRGTALER